MMEEVIIFYKLSNSSIKIVQGSTNYHISVNYAHTTSDRNRMHLSLIIF